MGATGLRVYDAPEDMESYNPEFPCRELPPSGAQSNLKFELANAYESHFNDQRQYRKVRRKADRPKNHPVTLLLR